MPLLALLSFALLEAARAEGLPAGWGQVDIGSSGTGTTSVSGSTWTISGAGSDIWTPHDRFHYTYRQISGNGSMTVHVASLTNTNEWAKAGIMFRQNVNVDDGYGGGNCAFVLACTTVSHGCGLEWRDSAGEAVQTGWGGSAGPSCPAWVRLERNGNTFSGYYSSDGNTWTPLPGSPHTTVLTDPCYVGFAVCSHVEHVLATAVFDSVTLPGGGTPPPGNAPPVARAGPDVTVEDLGNDGSEQVTLDGSASTDSDGTIQSWVWKEGATQLATGATVQVTLSRGRHVITLTVTDDDGATGTDTVVVNVVNYPPVANAGPDIVVRDTNLDDMATVSLNGTGSYDPSTGGSITSYVWTEAGVQVATGSNPNVTLAVGTHVITLTVTDNGGAQDTDSVTVTVLFQDDDSDGMSDVWERTYFSDLSEGPADDYDGDGATNLAEFLGRSDPTDPASLPPASSGGTGISCAPGAAGGASRLPAAAALLVVLAGLGRLRSPATRPAVRGRMP